MFSVVAGLRLCPWGRGGEVGLGDEAGGMRIISQMGGGYRRSHISMCYLCTACYMYVYLYLFPILLRWFGFEIDV